MTPSHISLLKVAEIISEQLRLNSALVHACSVDFADGHACALVQLAEVIAGVDGVDGDLFLKQCNLNQE